MQRSDIKPTNKHYSPADIERIKLLQYLRKLQISRDHIRSETANVLGEKRTIDLSKKSAENLRKVKERLRKGALLPLDELATLNKEKKPSQILTPKEVELFKAFLDKKHTLQHTTSYSSFQKIQSQQSMLDPAELQRRGLSSKHATPDKFGIEQNIFFGIGSDHSSLPLFVRHPTNFETKEPEDYTTIQIDFMKMIEMQPHIAKAIWASGHFYHYHASSVTSVIRSFNIGALNLASLDYDKRMSPVTLGNASFHWCFEEKSKEQKQQEALTIADPLARTQYKVLNFTRTNGAQTEEDTDDNEESIIKQYVEIDDEVTSGPDILPFFAYTFIERLRLLGGTMRDYLLSHPHDIKQMEAVIETFFRVDDFEIHIPNKLILSPEYTQVITPHKRKAITETMRDAGAQGDIAALERLLAQGHPLDGYMYEDPYYFDGTPAVDSPLIAAIKAGKLHAVNWLIEKGAHAFAFKTASLRSVVPYESEAKADNAFIIAAALESGIPEVLDCLVQHGLNLNSDNQSRLRVAKFFKSARHADPILMQMKAQLAAERGTTKATKRYKKIRSDSALLDALRIIGKTGKLEMIEAFIKHSAYASEPDTQKYRLLYDAAVSATPAVFNYILTKFRPLIESVYYVDLFFHAVSENNIEMAKYLYTFISVNMKLPVTRQDWAENRKEKSEINSKREKLTRIDRVDLYDYAISSLEEGHIEIANWLFSLSYPIAANDLARVAFTMSLHDDETLEARVKWLVNTAMISPCAPLTPRSFNPVEPTTLLSHVIKQGSENLATWLISEFNIDPNKPLVTKKSPMQETLEQGNLPLAKFLLTRGGTVPQDTELFKKVIREENCELLEWLLANGANLNHEEVMTTACTEGTPEIIEKLTAANIPLPAAERAQELFSTAIKQEKLSQLKWLTKHYTFNAGLYQDQFVALFNMQTLLAKVEPLLAWLLSQGLSLTAPDSTGHTILDNLLGQKSLFSTITVQCLDYLELHGVDVKTALRLRGPHVLFNVIGLTSLSAGKTLAGKSLSYLLSAGVPSDFIYSRDDIDSPCAPITPLEYACSLNGDTDTVRTLLKAGAKPTSIHNSNATALHYACGQSLGKNARYRFSGMNMINNDIIFQLIAAGAPVNIGLESPLTALCKHPNPPIPAIEALLKAGADVNYGTSITALFAALVASEKPNPAVIECLLKAGANAAHRVPGKKITIRDMVAADYPELTALFDQYAPTPLKPPVTSSPTVNTPNKRVFLTAAPRDASCAEAGTGDIDYANTLVNILQQSFNYPITNVTACDNEQRLLQTIQAQTLPTEQPVLHVLVNAPYTGFMLTPDALERFKQKGIQIVLTVVEFAKSTNRATADTLLSDTLAFIRKADRVIFLDENDRQSAQQFAQENNTTMPPSDVIAVPCTVPVTNKPLEFRDKNILSFGMIRKGKGMSHILKLAQLIMSSQEDTIKRKKILVTGKIGKIQNDKMDATLYELMKAIYPSKVADMHMKTPYELVGLLAQWKEDPTLISALPIELHVNVSAKALKQIFDRCTYSYLPAYRGATLRNSSISSSIANSFITYVHEGLITPPCLLPSGNHSQAIVLIPYDKKRAYYEYAADTVLEDMVRREKDELMNTATACAAVKLVEDKISADVIASQHNNVYTNLPQIRATAQPLLAPASRLFTSPGVDESAKNEALSPPRPA